MKRRTLLQAVMGSRAAAVRAGAGQIALGAAQRELIPTPDDPALWAPFRDTLVEWRRQTRARLDYDDALYRREDFAWVPSSFACCFLMMYDEAFYGPGRNRYMVDEFLDQAVAEFGGFDSVVLWHAYPRIGLDDRNQFDMYRDMPGGLTALREVSRTCHARGVKVFIDYSPWDSAA